MTDAYEFAYHPEQPKVLLGAPGGPVAVHAIGPDGAPAEERVRVQHHRSTLLCVGWGVDETLVSCSADGVWAVSDAATGEVQRHGRVEGEYLHASLSPAGASLVVCAYADDSFVVRIDVATGEVTQGPAIDEWVTMSGRVFALDADRALIHLVDEDWETEVVHEGVVRVDFAAGHAELATFSAGPASDFDSDSRLFAVDPIRGIGVRPDPRPIERTGTRDDGHALLRLEVFDLGTLEARHHPVVIGWPRQALEGPMLELETSEPGSEAYQQAHDWMTRRLCSAAFIRDAPQVWVGVQQGIVRRIALEGDERSALVIHGGGADSGPPTLDDVFARNLVNLRTLACSPDGRFVAFGNPNDFFCTDALDLSGPAVRLPMRGGAEVVDPPGFVGFARDCVVVFDRGCGMYLADRATGEPRSEIPLPELYGDARDVAVSEDGRFLAVAVAGGESFVWDREDETLLGTGLPPHMIAVEHVQGSRFAFVHHNGAVALLDIEGEWAAVVRAGEEGEPPDEDFDAFEQRWDVYASGLVRVGDEAWMLVVEEEDDLRTYVLGEESIDVGEARRLRARRMTGGQGLIAVASGESVQVHRLPDWALVATHSAQKLRALSLQGGRLFAFDDAAGHLLELPVEEDSEPRICFAHPGPSVRHVAIDADADRVLVVGASGRIELLTLDGAPVATLALHPVDSIRRELVRVTE